MSKLRYTAKQRLEPFGHASRVQSEQATYDMSVKRDVALKLYESERARREAAEALLRDIRNRGIGGWVTSAIDAHFARYQSKD